ncbi:enoyl-CoA hydratase-related protein [Phytohabitans sp. ZYX-F-186]|uniref:Enoyl-CoA hydratase-related protein n=1 Tax=Phytohabitans maris TaxID=3071409 RepID=A0ABU0ZA02_9ACTN|nr:enoyl-CoA hydratase-related protein [Phytohabitans sp. ZYX-F-186]MDQ7903886.1 enoyl-CoA hydratase-related protein [Phytohabitans sp. ZYX-F-186]
MEADTRSRVLVERQGPVLLVVLDRPEKRNAVDEAMTRGLDAAFARLESEPALRVGILAANGPAFCAGSDLLGGPGDPTPDGGPYGLARRVRRKPLVAAVDGPALGGGFELVLACDLVVASTRATFSLPEARRGRVANAGGLFRAPHRLPRNLALELLLTGGQLDATRAHRVGLVNRLTGPGGALAGAVDLAIEICRSAPSAVAQVLGARRAVEAAAEEAGWRATGTAVADLRGSADWVEGTAAFREKRPARWEPGE